MVKKITRVLLLSSIVFLVFSLPKALAQEEISMAPSPPHYIGELSLVGWYGKTTYGDNVYSTTRRYTASLGVKLTPVTEIQVAYGNVNYFFRQAELQTVTVNEQTLSVSLVQTLVPPNWIFQPYVKGGAAQYNRKQNSTINGIALPEVYTKSPSALLGGGARLYFLRDFAFKLEFTAYFPNFKISEGRDNIAVEGGLSWYF